MPDLGFTGGSQVLYQFMERLAQRDHEVFLVTPGGSIRWQPGMAALINSRKNDPVFQSVSGELFADMDLAAVNDLARNALGLESGPLAISALVTASLTEGLMKHWLPSDITVATHNFTANAAFHLMDRTLAFYHIQAYEEAFSYNSCLQKLARMTYFLPLRLMANSTWTAKRVSELTNRPCRLLCPGIDTRVFRPFPEDAGKFDRAGEFRVISCHSDAPHKGWKDAVAAMQIAAAGSSRRLNWVIFGGRPAPVEGVEIEFHGKVFGSELARLYSGSHACLVPSWFESFPLPPLEAMATGTAVVTTPVGSEDYAFNGKNALTVPARNPQAMAAALLRLTENPALCLALTEAGAQTATRFCWDNAVKRLEIMFAEAVDDSSNDKFTKLMAELAPGLKAAAERAKQ
jgi:glycosyltransferase involved in cell wall biosynthesis